MLSREVQAMLASDERQPFLAELYGDEPRAWRDDLAGFDRLRVVVNACTRLRFCTADGDDGVQGEARAALRRPRAFAMVRARASRVRQRSTIVCGHWSTLELKLAPNLLMLDSGCLWGGALTAVRLDGSPGVPGAGPSAGDAKAVRIASPPRSPARGGAARARATRRRQVQLGDRASARPSRARTTPEARRRRRKPERRCTSSGRRRDSGSRPAARGRPRRRSAAAASVERQQPRAVGRRSFGKHRDDVAARERVDVLAIDLVRVAPPRRARRTACPRWR